MTRDDLEVTIEEMQRELCERQTNTSVDENLVAGPDGAIGYKGGAAWLPTRQASIWWENLLAQYTAIAQMSPDVQFELGLSETDVVLAEAYLSQAPSPRWGPPRDYKNRITYYKLINKAKRSRSHNPGQATALEMKARKLEELYYD